MNRDPGAHQRNVSLKFQKALDCSTCFFKCGIILNSSHKLALLMFQSTRLKGEDEPAIDSTSLKQRSYS